MSLAQLTLHDAADRLRKREFTAVELTEAVYEIGRASCRERV